MTTPDETVQTEVDEIRVRLLPDGRMTRADAARYLGLQPKTLSMWRLQGKGPRVTRVGGRVFYFKSDLDTFIRGETTPAPVAA